MPVNRKMMKSMKEQYGPEKGERVYYAKEQKMKKKSGYMGGGMAMKNKKMAGYAEGGQVDKPGKPKRLREVPETNTGLKQLPEKVRNRMGYMSKGGMASKAKGYNKGGYANCGASMKPNREAKT